jgi:hypothetical protein
MQKVGEGQDTAMIGWPAPTGADGVDQGDGTVVDVVEDGAFVVEGPPAVRGGVPPQALRTKRTVTARAKDSDGTGDRRHLVLVSSTAHCPMGGSGRRGGRPLGPTRPTRHFVHSCDSAGQRGQTGSGGLRTMLFTRWECVPTTRTI